MADTLPAPKFPIPPTLYAPGEHLRLKDVYVYRCPLCCQTFRYDDPYEPLCTGPNPTLDEHAPEVMRLWRIEQRRETVFLRW